MIATKMNTFTKPHKFGVSIFVVAWNAVEGLLRPRREIPPIHTWLVLPTTGARIQKQTQPGYARKSQCLQFKVFGRLWASFAHAKVNRRIEIHHSFWGGYFSNSMLVSGRVQLTPKTMESSANPIFK